MRVAFNHHVLGELYGTRLGDLPNIIAAQVNQHKVFGNFLGVLKELLGERGIFLRIATAFTRAGDRAHCHLALLQAHQNLRRGTHDLHFAKVHKIQIGRRIHIAQRPVQGERRFVKRQCHSLRRHHLHDIPCQNIFLDALDPSLESRLIRRKIRTFLNRPGVDGGEQYGLQSVAL